MCESAGGGGVLLLEPRGALALEQAGCGDGIKRMSRIQQFKNKPYFGQVMNIEQYIAVSNELRTDFNLLPESERKDEYAVFKARVSSHADLGDLSANPKKES